MMDPHLVHFFHSTGYVRLPETLPAAWILDLRMLIDGHFAKGVAPVRMNKAGQVTRLDGLVDRHPIFLTTLRLPLVLNALISLLGPNDEVAKYRHNHATLNRAGGIPFRLHRDIQQWSRPLLSVFIYLEDANVQNGCTHIVPGSHIIPYAGPQSGGGFGNWADEHEEYRCLIGQELPVPMPKGGVLLMNSLVFHSVGINHGEGTRVSLVFACHSADDLIPSTDRESTMLIAGNRQFKGNLAPRISGSLKNPEVEIPD